ncbi:MAG: phosphonate ABC transporter ATP-binding protein [Mycoplasmatales bacterium]|nr:phosphonate ABC transporter ATP-binding protein [Mycoplasmatales bacterium]
MEKEPQIIFNDVSLTYPNGFQALSSINIEITRGSFVSIIGPSGAGKTTLMKTINKINEISRGKLTVNSKNISKLTGKALRSYRKDVGLVQQRYNLIETANVLNNVLVSVSPTLNWYRKIITFYTKRERLHALNALEKVNMLDKSYSRVADLSGGQMQRVALARTIAQSPTLILADEPVAALDPIMAKEIMDSFLKINVEDNKTIIANLHHVDLAIKYSDIIIGINNGKVAFFGPSSEITANILETIYGEKIELNDSDIKKAIKENRLLRKEYDEKG